MIQRKYNLNVCVAIALLSILLAFTLGLLQKHLAIFGSADALAIQIVKSARTLWPLPLAFGMTGVSWFGEELGVMIFICVIFWLGYTTEMITFVLLVIFGGSVIDHMKDFFALHRPLASEITTLSRARGYGYPSGHTQTGAFYAWLLFAFIQKYWLLCLIPAVLMAVSRMYLGVHYFSDTVGGMILGVGLAIGATGIYGRVRDLHSLRESLRRSLLLRIGLSLALSVGYLVVAWGQQGAFKYGGFLFGFFAVYSSLGFKWRSRNFFLTLVTIILGLVILLGIRIGFAAFLPSSRFGDYGKYFTLGLFLAISPLVFVKLRLLKRVEELAPVEEPASVRRAEEPD
jgi:membrane-associated phospholipid phosphatase